MPQCIRQYGEGSCRKPLNGPSLIAGEKLPAYQVTVSTPWKAFYKVDWEERTWECKCRPGHQGRWQLLLRLRRAAQRAQDRGMGLVQAGERRALLGRPEHRLEGH